MHVETIQIQRTFHIARGEWKGRKWTDFGFATSGETVHSASVYGHPEIRDAMHITVVLPHKGAWSSIVGWFEHGDGVIHIEGNANDWIFAGVFLFSVCLFGLSGIDAQSQRQAVGFFVMLAPCLLMLLFFGNRLIRKLRAAQQLRKLFPNAPRIAT